MSCKFIRIRIINIRKFYAFQFICTININVCPCLHSSCGIGIINLLNNVIYLISVFVSGSNLIAGYIVFQKLSVIRHFRFELLMSGNYLLGFFIAVRILLTTHKINNEIRSIRLRTPGNKMSPFGIIGYFR